MIHVCVCSGHEGELKHDKRFYLTLFGGCTLTGLTIARQVLVARRARENGRGGRAKPFFLTICGGGEIKVPTLAEEFVDLRELLQSGALTLAEWDRALSDPDGVEASISSLTLFGGFNECALPTENEEVEGIARHRHLGTITERAGKVLQLAVGQRRSERHATVRQAVLIKD